MSAATPTSPTGVPPTEPGWYLAQFDNRDEREPVFVASDGRVAVEARPGQLWWRPSDEFDFWSPLSSLLAAAARVPELEAALAETRRLLTSAKADARVLAHAYEDDNCPPPDVVARALAYRAGRGTPPSPPTEEGPKT